MEDFIIRIVEEANELRGKLNKLSTFMYGDTWATLSEKEQAMLEAQREAMFSYYTILVKRLNFYKGKGE